MVRLSQDDRRAFAEYLAKSRKELEDNTIGFRWYVMEHTPSYNTGGYYDRDIQARNDRVSQFFDTEEEAHVWRDNHLPDEGKSLHIVRQRLVRRVTQEWVNY